MLNALKHLKGKTRMETFENYSLAGVVIGALMFSVGIAASAIYTQGAPVVITMLGSFVSFVSSVFVVGIMVFKEVLGKE